MYKIRLLTLSLMLLVCFMMPAYGSAASKAEKLKDPAKNLTEYDALVEDIYLQGENSVPGLISLLQSQPRSSDARAVKNDLYAKVTAMNLLGDLKAKNALSVLAGMLERSGNHSIISNAARAMGTIGGNQANKLLEQILRKTMTKSYTMNEERQRAVIVAMGLCDNKKAIPYLLDVLNDTNNSELVRIYSAGSLGLLGNKDGLDVALKGLDSDDAQIKLSSIRALGLIGSDSSLDALTNLTKPDVDYVFKSAATLAIAQIESSQMPDDQKTDFIADQLEKHPKNSEFIQWGTKKLVKMGTPGAKRTLERLSDKKDPDYSVLCRAAKLRAKTIKE